MRIPLYNVVSPLNDANTSEPISMASAKNYVRALDTAGIPAKIVFARSVTINEYLARG
jgi:hypothetical protein